MKKLTDVQILKRNLKMGKVCRVHFKKTDGTFTVRWVSAIPADRLKGTGRKSCPCTVCFFDVKKQEVRSCRIENLKSVETEAQYNRKEKRAAERRQWVREARTIANFYGIGLTAAFSIVLKKSARAAYEHDTRGRYRESMAETVGSPYSTLAYGL